MQLLYLFVKIIKIEKNSSITHHILSTEMRSKDQLIYLPVQTKISCLFEIEFSETEKKVVAIDKLHKRVLRLPLDIISVNPTIKIDGTCCLIRNGQLYKRYDRKLNSKGSLKNKIIQKHLNSQNGNIENKDDILQFDVNTDFKEGPSGWIPCDSIRELFETQQTHVSSQHLVGWVPVNSNEASDKWHATAIVTSKIDNEKYATLLVPYYDEVERMAKFRVELRKVPELEGQTLELIGSKINGNVYNFPKQEKQHFLCPHGWASYLWDEKNEFLQDIKQIKLDSLKRWFDDPNNQMSKSEGIVFHVNYKENEQSKTLLLKVHRDHLNLQWPTQGFNPQFNYESHWLEELEQLKKQYKCC